MPKREINGIVFDVPDGPITASLVRETAHLPEEEMPVAITPDGKTRLIPERGAGIQLEPDERVISMTRAISGARDITLLNGEIAMAQKRFGPQRIRWGKNYLWVMIYEFPLPPGKYNQAHTNLLVLVPENYGYGQPYRDAFVSPGLKARHRGYDEDLPHYYDRYPYSRGDVQAQADELVRKGWAYICLHQSCWKRGHDHLLSFLDQLYVFLDNIFEWDRLVGARE